MKRKDREITDAEEMIKILEASNVMHIAVVDGDRPYIIPMNYGYTWKNERLTLYFHSALEGRKLDILRENNRVCFELDCDLRLVTGDMPCQYGYEFTSVIGDGRAEIIESSLEKIECMKIFMKHISGKDFDFNEKLVGVIAVIKVEVESFTGKKRIIPKA